MSELGDRRLTNAWQGALAGGGDPASSPLYVFGPFLTLLVGAGVASSTFGASIWIAVLTIAVVALLYRLVMEWVVDGSGGTGLSEEELGPGAAKISAAITCIEYTLTFLVSIAALVSFVADRAGLEGDWLGVPQRVVIAVGVSIVTGALVNRGPRIVSAVFGPATAGVLVLLWAMMIATVIRRGIELPAFRLDAFRGDNLGYTLGGYVRILALMTGIEVFANLVASYAGPAAVRSRRAFMSLGIIMGSTALTMVVVGPAILALADPRDPDVSVFTQTMDALLPRPLALAGTALSVLVLLSAAAASAIGIQSLFLGLSIRHYAPAVLGHRNRAGVAGRPVWSEVAVVCVCFVALGTREATYLAIYAAGVFVLLSMTSWSAVLRLVRRRGGAVLATRAGARDHRGVRLAGVVVAALFTSLATVVIFVERFTDGVWLYFVLVPVLAFAFDRVRRWRGDPGALADRIGRLASQWNRGERAALALADVPEAEVGPVIAHLDGDGKEEGPTGSSGSHDRLARVLHEPILHPAPAPVAAGRAASDAPRRLGVPLDGSANAEHALGYALAIARCRPVVLHLIHVVVTEVGEDQDHPSTVDDYLALVAATVAPDVFAVEVHVVRADPAAGIIAHADAHDLHLTVIATRGLTGLRQLVMGSVAHEVVIQRRRAVFTVPAHRR